jgi:quercetin dioxygenase-like cupin family protein
MTRRDVLRPARDDFRWEGVKPEAYKKDGAASFRGVSRQILFADPRLAAELRYFEIAPGGYSSLERHAHMHAVMILRGRGRCLVGDAAHDLAPHDLVTVPEWTWHQFHAAADAPLGFLCLVDAARDAPQRPDENDLAALRAVPAAAEFLAETERSSLGDDGGACDLARARRPDRATRG